MIRAWLSPRIWPSEGRSSLLVHSRNWRNQGKEDTERLTETAHGSGRFVNADGTVIYLITHVTDQKLNLVKGTASDTANHIFMTITDPKIGLDAAPQVIIKNGLDSEEYWSLAEPRWQLITFPYGPYVYKPWSQTSEEIKDAQFHLRLSGPSLPEKPTIKLSWEDAEGIRQTAYIPLAPAGKGTFKSQTPLLAFAPQGCDIGGTWRWTEKVPTPQFPGVITFREKNVRWECVSAAK